jgi:hypothetical protein
MVLYIRDDRTMDGDIDHDDTVVFQCPWHERCFALRQRYVG